MPDGQMTKFETRGKIARTAMEMMIELLDEHIYDEAVKEIVDDIQFAIFDLMSAMETAKQFKIFEEGVCNDNN